MNLHFKRREETHNLKFLLLRHQRQS